jgi:SAM-dependent methyltransferase
VGTSIRLYRLQAEGREVDEDTGDPLTHATAHAGLGLPVPRDTRFRALKRLVARFQRMTTHHQVTYNQALLEELRILRARVAVLSNSLSDVRDAHSAQIVFLGNSLSDVRDANATQITNQSVTLRSEIATLVERLTTHEAYAGTTAARLDVASKSLKELTGELRVTLDRVALVETEQQLSRQRELAERAVDRLRVGSQRTDPMISGREPCALSDDLSFALEETFRGTFDDVRERLLVHLDPVRTASAAGPALDLGCGRGEWLTILQEAGLEGYGVDRSALAVEHCRARRLDVLEGDLLEHLGKLEDQSLGAITAFHVVEHLPLDALLAVLSHAVRVLRPGGVLVIETPNVANVRVGASTFHLDPTHISALHPSLLEFLVTAHGFGSIAVRFLNPAATLDLPPAASPELAHAIGVFNELMFSAQDVAVVGWRPSD